MTLGRKVDDKAWPQQAAVIEDMHASRNNFTGPTCFLVCFEILGERLLELQRDAAAHDANRVHGVHQCLNRRGQQIALGQFRHNSKIALIPSSSSLLYEQTDGGLLDKLVFSIV